MVRTKFAAVLVVLLVLVGLQPSGAAPVVGAGAVEGPVVWVPGSAGEVGLRVTGTNPVLVEQVDGGPVGLLSASGVSVVVAVPGADRTVVLERVGGRWVPVLAVDDPDGFRTFPNGLVDGDRAIVGGRDPLVFERTGAGWDRVGQLEVVVSGSRNGSGWFVGTNATWENNRVVYTDRPSNQVLNVVEGEGDSWREVAQMDPITLIGRETFLLGDSLDLLDGILVLGEAFGFDFAEAGSNVRSVRVTNTGDIVADTNDAEVLDVTATIGPELGDTGFFVKVVGDRVFAVAGQTDDNSTNRRMVSWRLDTATGEFVDLQVHELVGLTFPVAKEFAVLDDGRFVFIGQVRDADGVIVEEVVTVSEGPVAGPEVEVFEYRVDLPVGRLTDIFGYRPSGFRNGPEYVSTADGWLVTEGRGTGSLGVWLTDVSGPVCDGFFASTVGTNGDDTVTGTDGADVIFTGPGNDTVTGLAGDDRICVGGGDDSVDAGAGDDRVFGWTGNDRLEGFDGDDLLVGGPDNDSLVGAAGDDTLLGRAGLDGLFGGPGADTLRGGGNNDRLRGGPGEDLLFGDAGADELDGSDDTDPDQLFGGVGPDSCSAGLGDVTASC